MNLNNLLIKLKNRELLYVDNNLKYKIFEKLENTFINLNYKDLNILNYLLIHLIDIISYKFYFKINQDEFQWTINNFQDTRACLNLLLPYIDDKNNEYLFKQISNLSQILTAYNIDNISKNHFKMDSEKFIKSYCKWSNFLVGILPNDNNNFYLKNKDDTHMIYDIIYNNYMCLIESLQILQGKYYINWINIIPISNDIDKYTKTELYKETEDKIKKLVVNITSANTSDENIIKGLHQWYQKYRGLWIGDIYNTFVHSYYKSIEKSKWIIYNYVYKRTGGNERLWYTIQIFDTVLDLRTLYENTDWDNVEEKQQNELENKWVNIINIVLSNNTAIINGFGTDVIKRILCIFADVFKKYYTYKTIVKNELKEQDEILHNAIYNTSLQRNINIDNIKLLEDNFINLLKFIKKVNFEHIWNYLYESYEYLKNSIYSEYLLEKVENKEQFKINNKFEYMNNLFNNQNICLKYIYNFGKSLYHNHLNNKNKQQWNIKELYFQSLNYSSKIAVIKRIFNINQNIQWFDINKNIYRMYKFSKTNSRKPISNNIMNIITRPEHIVKLVFHAMTRRGVLSKFVSDKYLSDKNLLPNRYIAKNKKIEELMTKKFKKDENKYWKNCYYYLTNRKFKELPKFRKLKNSFTKKRMDYFDYLANETKWYTFYAMNWITQINFYNHYIHNRIIYNTGATGQGKSTQTPKLLMFGLKMYEYKDAGKVICTQPRIPPTTGNANRISEELGVPITSISFTKLEKIRTNNFYVQYKYKNDNHLKKTNSHLTLKLVTDGTLYAQIIQNISMKVSYTKTIKDNKPSSFTESNIYDIMIVDEAHEHNSNMDNILTLARNSLYINNSLKLVIISATMDQDEAIYRRYYKIINDCIVYPLLSYIPTELNINDNNYNYRYNHNYVDRRFHISPPGASTQYTIIDIYKPVNLYEKFNYNIIQEKSIDLVLEICKKNPVGEILLFSIGQTEILELTKELNLRLNKSDIALPYFGELNEKYKNIIEYIDKQIINIKNKKENIHIEWGSDYIEDLSVPKGIYKRAIIIATNVAEASVTIPRLKFVVDNGYAKVNQYDPILGVSTLKEEKISESSRVQRRGRVGRISDGTVYYLYEKNARSDIKPKYNITQQDNQYIISSLVQTGNTDNLDQEEYNYLPEECDPNLWERPNNSNKEFERIGFDKIINSQYKINRQDLMTVDPSYWPEKHFKWMGTKRSNELTVFYTGFSIQTVLDPTGTFYLIHPNEKLIKRNILGRIIEYNGDKKLNIVSYEDIYKPFQKLTIKMKIVDLNIVSKTNILVNGISNIKGLKTVLGKKIDEFIQKIDNELTDEDAITFLTACSYNNYKDIIAMITMLQVCNKSLKSWYITKKIKGKNVILFKEFNYIWQNDISDLVVLYNIWKKLQNDFPNLFIINLLNNPNLLNSSKAKSNEYIKKYLLFRKEKGNSIDIPNDFDSKIFEACAKLYHSNKIRDKNAFKILYANLNDSFIDLNIKENYIKHHKKIELWCQLNYINKSTLNKFIERFYKISKKLITYMYKDTDKYTEQEDIIEIFKVYGSSIQKNLHHEPYELIIKPFLHGYPTQIALYNNSAYTLEHTLTKEIYNYNIAKLYKTNNSPLVTSIKYPGSVLHWISLSIFDTSIQIITNIKEKWLFETCPQYYNILQLDTYKYSSYNYLMFIKNILNSFSYNFSIWNDSNQPTINKYNNKLESHINHKIHNI